MPTTPPVPNPAPSALRERLLADCEEMIGFALDSGKRVPPPLVQAVDAARAGAEVDVGKVAAVHADLCVLVAPATPEAIRLLKRVDEGAGRWAFLGSVPLLRRMMGAAVMSVALFILLGIFDQVNERWHNLRGLEFLVNQVYWLSAAGIGASFAVLFQVSEYVVTRTYDPDYEPSYWIKFFLGVIAGFILAALVPLGQAGTAAEQFGQPTLAMLGGFSASVVYRILTRLVDTVESLVRGDGKEIMAQRERAASARAQQETSQARIGMAGQLLELQQQMAAGVPGDQLAERLRTLVEGLVQAADGKSPLTVSTHDLAGLRPPADAPKPEVPPISAPANG